MNDRLKKHIRKLMSDSSYRLECGEYVIEGAKTSAETDLGLIKSVLVTEEFLCSKQALSCSAIFDDKDYTVISLDEMRGLSDTVTGQGIMLTAKMRTYNALTDYMEDERAYRKSLNIPDPLLVILEGVQDPGNLGTIIRSAEAAGASGVIVDRDTASLYSPKTVRSAMGSIPRLPCFTASDLRGLVKELQKDLSIYAAVIGGSCLYTDAALKGPSAILIGNESRGLSRAVTDAADFSISIPMTGETNSLNAAIAASVILFEAQRQRRPV